MIINPISRDTLILQNIVQTLQQVKNGAVTNYRLPLHHIADTCTVSFFVDEAKTQILFTETSDTFDTFTEAQYQSLTEQQYLNLNESTGSFVVDNTRTYYTPPDALINDAPSLSTTLAQPLYYVTATFSDGFTVNATYRNVDNLAFQSVIVSSKDKPEFTTTDNTAIIVARGQKTDIKQNNSDIIFILPQYEIYLQLTVLNWAKLSEQERANQGQAVNNLIRTALYSDSTRGGNCSFYSPAIYGTNVDSLKILPSTDLMKACVKVQTCYMAFGTVN